MSGADRCHTCDRPLATQADDAVHPDGCGCERCSALCWSAWEAAARPHGRTAELEAEVSDLRVRLGAECGREDDVPGWWYDESSEPHEAVWFLDLEGGNPWSVSVYRDEPGAPWAWDVDWNPAESHRGDRTIATGEAPTAYDAMLAATVAYDARPMPPGDPECECHGWRRAVDNVVSRLARGGRT